MHRAELICCFLLLQLLMAPMMAAVPVAAPRDALALNEEKGQTAVRKRATSNLLKGAAIGAVLGIAGAAAYGMYKNRQTTPPPTQTEVEPSR